MRQHRGNEVFIAANLKLRVIKYEYICHFYFFYKATILQLNLTIQQRSGVGNSPPLRQTISFNIISGSLTTNYNRKINVKAVPLS